MDAEDLTQLTFERALRAWGTFDPSRARVSTWLMAIARNAFIDHLRRGRETRETHADHDELERLLPASPAPGDLGLEPGLEMALAALTDREREVLALRFGADMTGPEIAEALDLTLANVQQIISRALRKLRARLEGERV